ncbi:MAG: DUF3575 domain-containing protein [Bacteroidales bacterium]|nr:DUF3575 domain-containing protein [Bacteroidales bacterium]
MPYFRWSALLLFLLLALFQPLHTSAQTTALKTNALYWATTTMNIDAETRFAPRWSGELSIGYNPWSFSDNKKIKHIAIQPEVRYWLCSTYAGHFFGAHLLYSHFNAGGIHMPLGLFPSLKEHRFQGDLGGIGLAYGYNFILSRHWSLELELGLGVIYSNYKKYECRECGSKLGREHKTFFSPTKIAVNMVYYLK